jgi:hypothetical protein
MLSRPAWPIVSTQPPTTMAKGNHAHKKETKKPKKEKPKTPPAGSR